MKKKYNIKNFLIENKTTPALLCTILCFQKKAFVLLKPAVVLPSKTCGFGQPSVLDNRRFWKEG